MKLRIIDTRELILATPLVEIIAQLPANMQARAKQYKFPEAAVNYCVGRLLLRDAVLEMGFDLEKLEQITYSHRSKPSLEGLFFNISHSGNFVGIAYSCDTPLGLDIEVPRPIVLSDFRAWFRKDEWQDIRSSILPEQRFYAYWVRKEAILKAADLPLSALHDIRILSNELGDTGNNTPQWILKDIGEVGKFEGVVAVLKS
jgi:4'-phosphopantetheinyl transferase